MLLDLFFSALNISDSYIDPDDFFRKCKIRSGSNLLFRGFIFDFFLSSFPLLRERQIPLSNSGSVKVTKNVIDF